tara:strand:- start:2728 stop:4401 length:1674 start_codon:yes stop_codon:yes gene_type:complete
MGNTLSTNEQKDSVLYKEIDLIATNYITSQTFQDMKNLSDMKYCNDLAIMTADIIDRKLNDQQVHYLAQRLKDGIEINEMTNKRVIYTKKSNLPDLDVSNATTKRRICIGIAKFYVKIAHLFAAIVTTINPVYIYKDSTGQTVKTSLMHKNDIPKDASTKIEKHNLCSTRINALVNKSDFDIPSDANFTIAPRFCDMNYDKERKRDRNLAEEPGVPELEKLYYDEYNYDEGGFTGMSDKMRTKVYEPDLLSFYKIFTGNDALPTNDAGKPLVRKFSQILLRDFHKSEGCKPGGVYTQGYTASLKNKLFSQYAEHLKTMMQNAVKNQDNLIKILRGDNTVNPPLIGLFSNIINSETGRKEVIVNPKLTDDGLQKLVVKARQIIVSLYLQCEDDFVKGLGIFEAIVEKQLMETSKEQMNKLNAALQESLTEVSELTGTTNSVGVGPDSEPVENIPEASVKSIGVDVATMDSPTDATVIGTDEGVEKTMTTTTTTTGKEKAGFKENIEDIKKDLAKERDALRVATEKISNLEKSRVQGPYLQSVLLPVMSQPSLVNSKSS